MGSVAERIRQELVALGTINRSDRPWEMPASVALASGGPLLLAAALHDMPAGAIASIGGMAILYLPRTPLRHRILTVCAAALAMTLCYALGLIAHVQPATRLPILTLLTIVATMAARRHGLIPPGSLFFLMPAAVGAYQAGGWAQMPERIGLFSAGAAWACLVGTLYSLHILRRRDPLPVAPKPAAYLDFVIVESILIGVIVGLSLALAELFAMDKPYWVPVSCLAVVQGLSLRAVWTRQVHRVVGTTLGLGVTFALLFVTRDAWGLAIAVTLLTFLVETVVVRHYGFAAMFITPLTILLAEAPTLGHADSGALIAARFADTVLGAVIGFAGGACLHSRTIRAPIARMVRAVTGARG